MVDKSPLSRVQVSFVGGCMPNARNDYFSNELLQKDTIKIDGHNGPLPSIYCRTKIKETMQCMQCKNPIVERKYMN